jgi:hypothetical protein
MRAVFFGITMVFHLSSLNAQSLLSKFSKLSRPEKCWTVFHAFAAKSAFRATVKAQAVTDSLSKSGSVGNDNSGGKLDAFKHAYWIASVSSAIGPRKALKLGEAHEKGNKLQFKKHQLEDRELPDSISSCMDLYNNEQGAKTVKANPQYTLQELQQAILKQLTGGQLKCIRKDEHGNFLTCDGKLINKEEWFGKWNVPKCLVPSDF